MKYIVDGNNQIIPTVQNSPKSNKNSEFLGFTEHSDTEYENDI